MPRTYLKNSVSDTNLRKNNQKKPVKVSLFFMCSIFINFPSLTDLLWLAHWLTDSQTTLCHVIFIENIETDHSSHNSVLTRDIYILAIPPIPSPLKNRKELEGGLEKRKGKEEKKERKIKHTLKYLYEAKKSTRGANFSGWPVYIPLLIDFVLFETLRIAPY